MENWKTFTTKLLTNKFLFSMKSIINILSNFVLNETVTIGDSNPCWMNDFLKTEIK